MFFTNFLHYLNIAWIWIKKYWFYFLFIIGFIVFTVLLRNKNKQVQNLLKMLQDQTEQHNKDLVELQRIHEEEIQKRQEIQNQYEAVIARINTEHAEALANLNRQKEKEIKNIIQEFGDDPDKMAQSINQLLGIPIKNNTPVS